MSSDRTLRATRVIDIFVSKEEICTVETGESAEDRLVALVSE